MSDWIVQANKLAYKFCKEHYEFCGEELSDFLIKELGEPPSLPVLGRVTQELSNTNVIMPIGTTNAKKKSAKGRRVVRWRSTISTGDAALITVRESLHAIRIRFTTRQISLDDALMEAYKVGTGSL